MCKSWCEAVFAIIILVFAIWQTTYSRWIIIVMAVILLVHSFTCKSCFARHHMGSEAMHPARSKRRR